MHAVLGRLIAVLWEFQRTAPFLGGNNHTDEHQQEQFHDHFIFQLLDKRNNSSDVDHDVISNEFIYDAQSLVPMAWQLYHLSPGLDCESGRQHAWGISNRRHAPSELRRRVEHYPPLVSNV